jgi:ribonuclease D
MQRSSIHAPDAKWASEGATRGCRIHAPDAMWASEGATKATPDAMWASEGATKATPDAMWASEGATKAAPDAMWASEGASKEEPPVTSPRIKLHKGDLPAGLSFGTSVAVDTETLGLKPHRDRLCLVQLSAGNNEAHLVQLDGRDWSAPRLKALLADPAVLKIFHFARFDVAVIERYLGVVTGPLWCTKIASKLVRTYTDRHGLKDLVSELLGVELSKQQQSSDWAAADLSQQQQHYAASDVLHLHALKARLEAMLAREGRTELAEAAFRFLPVRARMDLGGFEEMDIFSH